MTFPRCVPAGDAALVVEFGDRIDRETSRRVMSLAEKLTGHPAPGLSEVVPSYRSLLIHYDPLLVSYQEILDHVHMCLGDAEETRQSSPHVVELPTAYGDEFGPDLSYVAAYHDLSLEDVIRIHSEREYYVFMLGFTPGFPYLGGLDPAIATPRLATPRTCVAAGSVGIGGNQTGVYSVVSPGGWRIIGRTTAVLFDAQREPPALLKPGNLVRFKPVPVADLMPDAGNP